MSLFLELVDVFFLVSDHDVPFLNVDFLLVDSVLQILFFLLLESNLKVFFLNLPEELVGDLAQFGQFVLGELKLCFRSERHFANLLLVLLVLALNVLLFIVSILSNLFKDLVVVFLLTLNFFFELLSLCNLAFHERSVLINDSVHILVVGLNDISNDLLKVTGFLLFLGL